LRQDKPTTRSKRFLSDRDIADMIARYEGGESTQQIGSLYGISKTRVATVLREQGITIRRQGLSDDRVREAAEFYLGGKSVAWIAAHLDVSHTTVAVALRRHGIQLRPRPGWG
jgi:transcriptional regulator of aromatic amino acid metabolism